MFLLGTLLIHAVLIRKSVLNKNKFNYSQNTANYLISLHDNEMIFTSFDAADISALRYVKKIFIMKNDLIKKELLQPSKNLFLLGTLHVLKVFYFLCILHRLVVLGTFSR